MSYAIQDLVIRNVAPGDTAEIIILVGRSEVDDPVARRRSTTGAGPSLWTMWRSPMP